MRAAFAMRAGLAERLFSEGSLAALASIVEIDPSVAGTTIDDLADVEVLITGWGTPAIGGAELDRMPNLRAIVHAAGTVKGLLSTDVWERGITVTSAAMTNAIPVAEYTLAMIILAGKDVFALSRLQAASGDAIDLALDHPAIGNHGRVVGVVGASRIGRHLLGLLSAFDFEVLVYDPYLSDEKAAGLGARRVDLDELLVASDIVTLHAPAVESTRHMINERTLGLMKRGAHLINTARGSLIDEAALVDALRAGRISAVLDVTEQEPLSMESPLRTLANVTLTPHLAGAFGNELERLGELVIEQVAAITEGREPQGVVTLAMLDTMA